MKPKRTLIDNQKSWEKFYDEFKEQSLLKEYKLYKERYLEDTLNQIFKIWKPKKTDIYLEIGCGPCFLGLEIAKITGVKVIGIDFSSKALRAAKYLFKKEKNKNAQFILGDITNIPLPDNSVNFIFGGGVIEHLENVQDAIDEMFRVLKKGGRVYNTVPFLNIASLTYRQVWGNIPYIPLVKNIFEFIHIRLLGGKHMRFGYELSFLPSTLYKMHLNSGFKKIEIDKFTVNLVFEYLPFSILRKIAIHISNHSILFWPIIYITAKK